MVVQAARRNNGAQKIGKAIGYGTQQTAKALRGTLGAVSKVGKGLGALGYGLSAASILYKGSTNQAISTAEKVSFGIGTVFVGAGVVLAGTAAAPFVAAGALIYGAAELFSYGMTGNSLEENYFEK